jgi:cation transport ATPase
LLIVGGLIFLVKIKFYFMVLAVMSWIGIMAIAFVGESLIKNKHKFIIAIMILTIPCLLGLGVGWQIWKLATQWS